MNRSKMSDQESSDLFHDICPEDCGVDPRTLENVITLAVELAREGREGRKIGTLFVIGDSDEVLERSRALILDPLWYHPVEERHIDDHNMRESIKELALLDGAFLITDDGVALSAARFLNANAEGIDLPFGLGTRHMAAASITKETNAIAVVVSESSVVRVFDNGELIAEIIPELWLLRRQGVHLKSPYTLRTSGEMAVVSKEE